MAVDGGTAVGNTYSAGPATTHNSPAFAMTSGSLYLIAVGAYLSSGAPPEPTMSGWTLVPGASVSLGGGNNFRLAVFSRVGAGEGSAAYTADYGASSVERVSFAVDVFTGQSGSFGTVVTATSGGSATPGVAGLAAFAAGSACFFADFHGWTAIQTADSPQVIKARNFGYYSLHTSAYAGEDLSPSATAGGSATWVALGFEILAAGAAATGDGSRGVARGVARGIGRGIASAMTMVKDGLLYRPRETRLVMPVGVAL